jgi:hypothetical protein
MENAGKKIFSLFHLPFQDVGVRLGDAPKDIVCVKL